jgi:hypothetical protein
VFEIGSITKVFTSLLLMDMTRRGEVALTDPGSKVSSPSVKVPDRNSARSPSQTFPRKAPIVTERAGLRTPRTMIIIVEANLLDNDPHWVSGRILAYALFIDRPLDRVRMTEAENRRRS